MSQFVFWALALHLQIYILLPYSFLIVLRPPILLYKIVFSMQPDSSASLWVELLLFQFV